MSDENERTLRKIPPPPEPAPAQYPPSIYWSDTAYSPEQKRRFLRFRWLVVYGLCLSMNGVLIAAGLAKGEIAVSFAAILVFAGVSLYGIFNPMYKDRNTGKGTRRRPLLFPFRVESEQKQKQDDPFYPEYWRDDVPPPPANPGYFESTR